ncbi:MAG: hypothetical protein SNJ84_00600 [Verrucomicrobiia bacterium]
MDPYAVYRQSAVCAERIPTVRLRNIEWSILFTLNEERTVHDLARLLSITVDRALKAINHLIELELIEEAEISYDQYMRNSGQGAAAEELSSMAEFLAQGRATDEQIQAKPPPPRSFQLPPLPGTQTRSPSPDPEPAPRSLRLGALIEFIVQQAPSQTEGQLAAYRIFLRVPPDLLKRNGIVSLSLLEDSTLVNDPELQTALLSATESILGTAVPESVLV